MGLLDQLMGGGEQQQPFQDFISRYQQGSPADGIDDEETAERYGQVAGEIDPDTYHQSAREALGNMGQDERAEYASQLGAAANQNGLDLGWDGSATDPDTLAQLTSTVHQQSPGLLGGLLGGGGGGGLGGLMGGGLGGGGIGGLLGGGGAGGLGGMLGGAGGGGNPIMRAVLGGIAATAAQRMMGRGR